MFSNLSAVLNSSVEYPIADNCLPFSEYILRSRAIIEERRKDLLNPGVDAQRIIDTNSPFEFYPTHPIRAEGRLKYGALLIHGLLDGPFSLQDIGRGLQEQGVLARGILLPGHGTTPADLLHVSYHDWIQAVRYGVETLRREVEQIFLVGYSTGATLSVYQALQDAQIAGIVMLSPAIRIKAPVELLGSWYFLTQLITKNNQHWIYRENEIDYAKYQSIPFHPVNEVNKLTKVIQELRQQHPINMPLFMVITHEDETISSERAIHFFSQLQHPESQLLLYSARTRHYADQRIEVRNSQYPDLHIKHLSHVSIPFAPTNPHYGQCGDFSFASKPNSQAVVYGAYNRFEEKCSDVLQQLRIMKCCRRQLTYNPDFEFMLKKMMQFVLKTNKE